MQESLVPNPTPYAGVNAVLQEFVERIRSILGSQCVGLYLYGSLALGDFDPDTSDIDFIVVTQGEVVAELIPLLREIHAHFDRSDSPWAGRIEAAYIPLEALNHRAPTSATYPHVEKGTELFLAPLEIGWAFQRWTLRERGVKVEGPDLQLLIEPVDPADMQRAAAVITHGWQEQSRQDSSWIDWARQRSSLSFVVLTLCRLLYSLEKGAVVSKPEAARWARENLDRRWEGLIQRSLAGQQDKQEGSELDLEEMLALLSYTLEKSQQVAVLSREAGDGS